MFRMQMMTVWLIQHTGGFLFVVTIMGRLSLLENTNKGSGLSTHSVCPYLEFVAFLYNIFRLIESKSQKENTFMWFSEWRLKCLH